MYLTVHFNNDGDDLKPVIACIQQLQVSLFYFFHINSLHCINIFCNCFVGKYRSSVCFIIFPEYKTVNVGLYVYFMIA